ncbi:MAG: chorion class high-cysteine HCB protein 13 [Clostridia bacterium]|nr:chorion class high-cysteine HCB protein 13 [Clostridia bacterium]
MCLSNLFGNETSSSSLLFFFLLLVVLFMNCDMFGENNDSLLFFFLLLVVLFCGYGGNGCGQIDDGCGCGC